MFSKRQHLSHFYSFFTWSEVLLTFVKNQSPKRNFSWYDGLGFFRFVFFCYWPDFVLHFLMGEEMGEGLAFTWQFFFILSSHVVIFSPGFCNPGFVILAISTCLQLYLCPLARAE